jgi:hypothetical protein
MAAQKKIYTFSAATLSWIDPRTGLPEVDDKGQPASSLSFDGVTREENCRFSHLLSCSIVVSNGKIVERYAADESNIYLRPSFLGTTPQRYEVRRDFTSWNAQQATFVQTVGCRTQAPEVIGGTGGEIAGDIAGAFVPIIGPEIGPRAGKRIGRELAELAETFPPIWTRISIVLFANGRYQALVKARSLFPSMSFYESQVAVGRVSTKGLTWKRKGAAYNAIPHYQAWRAQGWGKGNPWLVKSPARISNDAIR